MAWKRDGRSGVVVRGAGGSGGDSIRIGGRVPWGAEVEYAYRAGYDSRGRVSVTHVVDERGYSASLNRREAGAFSAMAGSSTGCLPQDTGKANRHSR